MTKIMGIDAGAASASNNISYIRDMLAELRNVADREGADLLCYLIEMAYVEAGDLHSGTRSFSIEHGKRN
jgi:peptidase E